MRPAPAALLALLLLLLAPSSASAITYEGTILVPGGSAVVSITTDGTLGDLESFNILSWDITLDANGTRMLDETNSVYSAVTASLPVATPTTLTLITTSFSTNAYAFSLIDPMDLTPDRLSIQSNGTAATVNVRVGPDSFTRLDQPPVDIVFTAVPEPGLAAIGALAALAFARRVRPRR